MWFWQILKKTINKPQCEPMRGPSGPMSCTCMRMHARVHAYVCVHAHVCVRVRTCVCVCVCVNVCMHAGTCACVHM